MIRCRTITAVQEIPAHEGDQRTARYAHGGDRDAKELQDIGTEKHRASLEQNRGRMEAFNSALP